MPRNLSNSQKSSFLRKRISDAETLAAKEVTFVEKNYPSFEKKVTLLNQVRRKRANSIAILSIISERERTLSRQVRNFRERRKTLEQVSQWVETDKRATSNLRKSNNDKQQPDPLVAFCKIIVCLPLLGGVFPLSMGPTRSTFVKRRLHSITAFYCFPFCNLGKAISGS